MVRTPERYAQEIDQIKETITTLENELKVNYGKEVKVLGVTFLPRKPGKRKNDLMRNFPQQCVLNNL